MRVPPQAGVVYVGYLDDAEKMQALAAASATIIPSSFESLSVVALESWAVGTPVAASARSRAVVGQCARSRAGITYSTYDEFRAALDRLRSSEGRECGENGRGFVAEQCSWERILSVYRRAVERASGASR
jgi:glycosyltransferase involved in cell wall biosynthesis